MKKVKKILSLLLCTVVIFSACGCTIPTIGYTEYDCSRYIRMLFNASYKNNSVGLIEYVKVSEEVAKQYNIDTISNGAVNFCNQYGINPNDEQLEQIKAFIAQAYSLAKFNVKEQNQTSSGYYIEVDVSPLTAFYDKSKQFNLIHENIVKQASLASQAAQEALNSSENEDTDYDEDYDEDEYYDEDSESSAEPTPSPTPAPVTIDPNTAYVDAVIEYCENALKAPEYNSNVTVTLTILQGNDGSLSLDTTEIDKVDKLIIGLD